MKFRIVPLLGDGETKLKPFKVDDGHNPPIVGTESVVIDADVSTLITLENS